jgi:uncharacterized membrane protein
MKLIVVLGIHFITAFIVAVSGLLCWKCHSVFPNTSIGYRVGFAMQSSEAWESVNCYVGKMLIFIGILDFFVLPLVIYFLLSYSTLDINSEFWLLFGTYFVEIIALLLCLFGIPMHKYKNSTSA